MCFGEPAHQSASRYKKFRAFLSLMVKNVASSLQPNPLFWRISTACGLRNFCLVYWQSWWNNLAVDTKRRNVAAGEEVILDFETCGLKSLGFRTPQTI